MTSHTHTVDLSQDQPLLPNQHFSSWLRGQTTLFVGQLVAILGIILFAAEEVYYVSHGLEHSKFFQPMTTKLIVDYAHIVFIAVFIVVLIKVLDENDRGSYRVKLVHARVFKEPKGDEQSVDAALETSKEQLKTFKRRFLWFWIGMLCLYISFTIQHTYNASFEQKEPEAKEVSFRFNGKTQGKEEEVKGELHLSIPDQTHVATPAKPLSDAEKAEKEKAEKERIHTKLIFAALAFCFNNITLLSVFWCFLVMYIRPDEEKKKKKERKYRVGSIIVVGSLTILFFLFFILKWNEFDSKSAGDYASIFDALSGVLNAVVLALLIARLDSKLVGLRPWLISILYSYAAVQPLFLVFEISTSNLLQTIATLVLIFVFISKIYFFLIIFYALQTGKMLNYLTCFPILRKRAEERRRPDADRVSVFTRLMRFVRSALPGLLGRAKSYWRGGLESAHVLERPKSAPPKKRHKRLGLTVSKWLRRYSLGVSEVIGWVAIIYFFGSLIGSQVLPNLSPPPAVTSAIQVAQLVFVALMIVTLHLIREDNRSGHRRAANTAESIFNERLETEDSMKDGEAQLKKFKKYFLYFWCVTLALYVIFLFHPQVDYSSPLMEILLLPFDPEMVYNLKLTFGQMFEVLLFPALEFLFASLNLMCAFWCFVVLHSPAFARPPSEMLKGSEMMRKHFETRHKRFEARQKLLVNYSTFGVLLLIAIYLLLLGLLPALSRRSLKDYATVFDGVTGLLSAIVLALLIARMDSKLFSLPSRLIWMLFTYASIQSLFIAFVQEDPVLEMVRTSVLNSALGFKICFFLIVAHSLQKGRMLNYLVCYPILKERVDSIFENQFEIRLVRAEDNEFTFLILKKNRLYYSAAKTFKSREACDEAVEELRGLMGKNGPYGSPRHSSGTYWVEVRSDKGLCCESIPLRSEEGAMELIAESIGKVPYCKYNRL